MKEFISIYWPGIIAAFPVILIIAKIIVKRTPTKVDDEIVETVEEIVAEVQAAKGVKK